MKTTRFKIKACRLLIGTLFAGVLPLSFNAIAQEAPAAQEKDPAAADAMLYALEVKYPTSYRAMETAEVKASVN